MNQDAAHGLAMAEDLLAEDLLAKDLLAVRDLRRTFGETIALDRCSLTIGAGEIHALVGENGSGKSTLIKILSGIMRPDGGELAWAGAPARFASPKAAQAAGVATVFQETLILDDMSIRDNMILGLDGIIRRRTGPAREGELVREGLAILGLEALDIERPAGSLSLANRQLVGVARSLLRSWRLLILDESTSSLDVEDRDRLFGALRRFRAEGRSILFVSHRMDEIEQLADRVTVLRSGRSVATLATRDASTEMLLEMMSTREGAKAAEGRAEPRAKAAVGEAVISVAGLAFRGRPPFDFKLHAGEIVGVGGLEGHGQAAFLECMAGLRQAAAGHVQAHLHAGRLPIRTPGEARRAGVAFLPRDRKTEGILANLSVMDNVTVSSLRRLAHWGILGPARRKAMADAMCQRTKVKMASRAVAIASLSGGNQQKALLGRLIATGPRVLVLNDPLRGVDLGAKRDLYEVLAGLAAEGMAILLLSTELSELCLLCDRVVVFHDHAVAAVVDRADLSERSLIEAMFGQSGQHAKQEGTREGTRI